MISDFFKFPKKYSNSNLCRKHWVIDPKYIQNKNTVTLIIFFIIKGVGLKLGDPPKNDSSVLLTLECFSYLLYPPLPGAFDTPDFLHENSVQKKWYDEKRTLKIF